jgi:hypothetical protein
MGVQGRDVHFCQEQKGSGIGEETLLVHLSSSPFLFFFCDRMYEA